MAEGRPCRRCQDCGQMASNSHAGLCEDLAQEAGCYRALQEQRERVARISHTIRKKGVHDSQRQMLGLIGWFQDTDMSLAQQASFARRFASAASKLAKKDLALRKRARSEGCDEPSVRSE